MEVATRAGMVVTRVATEDIMEAAALEGLQEAPSRGITLRIRILVPIRIRFRKIASAWREAVADDSRKDSEQV